MAAVSPIVVAETPLVFYRVRPSSQSHGDAAISWKILAISLALRFGSDVPDKRPAGGIYRHMLSVGASAGQISPGEALALGALGKLPVRQRAALVRSALSSKGRG